MPDQHPASPRIPPIDPAPPSGDRLARRVLARVHAWILLRELLYFFTGGFVRNDRDERRPGEGDG